MAIAKGKHYRKGTSPQSTPQARAKMRGSQFEVDIEKTLRAHLPSEKVRVARMARHGRQDQGDVAVDFLDGWVDVIECKAPGPGKPMNLTEWWREAVTEAGWYAHARGMDREMAEPLLVIKARQRPIREAWVVTTLERWYGDMWIGGEK